MDDFNITIKGNNNNSNIINNSNDSVISNKDLDKKIINKYNIEKYVKILSGKQNDYPWSYSQNPELEYHKKNRQFILNEMQNIGLLPFFNDSIEFRDIADLSERIESWENSQFKDKNEYTQEEINTKKLDIWNYIGIIKGTQFPDKYIMYSSHYDAADEHGPTPGACDPLSSVAVGLELARLFVNNPPKTSVIIAFWDGEERGLRGARSFVNNLSLTNVKSTDIIFGIWCDNLRGNLDYSKKIDDILLIDGPMHMRPRFDSINFYNKFIKSKFNNISYLEFDTFRINGVGDNIVLVLNGMIPTLFIATASSFKIWHKQEDVPEELNFNNISKIGQGIYEQLQEISNNKKEYIVPGTLNYDYTNKGDENLINSFISNLEVLNTSDINFSNLYKIVLQNIKKHIEKEKKVDDLFVSFGVTMGFGFTDIEDNIEPIPREISGLLEAKPIFSLIINILKPIADEDDIIIINELEKTNNLLENILLKYTPQEILNNSYESYNPNSSLYKNNIFFNESKISRLRYWFTIGMGTALVIKYGYSNLLPTGSGVERPQPGKLERNILYNNDNNNNNDNNKPKKNMKFNKNKPRWAIIGCGCSYCYES